MDKLPIAADTPGNFRGCDEIAAIDTPYDCPDARLPDISDSTENGVLEGRRSTRKLHGDAAVLHAHRGVIAFRGIQCIFDFGGQLPNPAQNQGEVVLPVASV